MTASPQTPNSPLLAVLTGLAGVRGWEEEFYRELHAHPELSHQESRTSSRVAARLAGGGYEVRDHVGGTGVVGVLRNGDGPTVLLRADMDALPVAGGDRAAVREHRNRDRRGRQRCRSCTRAATTCTSPACSARPSCSPTAATHWEGTLVALFQPAEETGDGARGMVDDELEARAGTSMSRWPSTSCRRPPVWSATSAGPVLSAADSMRITVHGRGAHGSMPQATVDPVVLAAMIVVRLQTIVSRRDAAERTRGADRGQHPGRHEEQRHPRPRGRRS